MNSDADRTDQINAFLGHAGWRDSDLLWFDQDASTRRYARLRRATGETVILMDAPRIEDDPCTPDMSRAERERAGWNAMTRLAASRVDAFVLIAEHLRGAGLRAPEIFAHDANAGFALLEDFGDKREFARLIEAGIDEIPLYEQAAQDLARLHSLPKPSLLQRGSDQWQILEFDSVALGANADLFADWFHVHDDRARMTDADRGLWNVARDELIAKAMTFPRDFTLRDYHAENLLWLPDNQIGLLDFQDAVLGWDAWDMAMLTQDARRAVSQQAAETAINTYLKATGKDPKAFHERLAVIGTLNALRIAGVFARLIERDGKPRYGAFLPRQIEMLAQNLKHPAAAEMRAFIGQTAPFILEVSK